MILDEICEYKQHEVSHQKAAVTTKELEERIAEARPARSLRDALRLEGMSLIAEVKLASPVKGRFLVDADPIDLASVYEGAGARAVSVLTDEKFFQGKLSNLTKVSRHVSVPCLRKEFIIDEYQIYEARAASADAILLIVRILSDEQLKEYIALSKSLGMDALVETHDAKEIERALDAGARIIGVNNRDLDSFEVDINTTLELKKMVPGGHTLVSESGITTREHVQLLEDGGIDAILVGEALVTSNNIAEKIRELLGNDKS